MSPWSRIVERVDQLAPKQIRAPAVEGQRRQRRHARAHAAEAPEVGLEAPHRDQHSRLDAVRLADARRERVVLAPDPPRLLQCVLRQTPPEVRLQIEREFGLLAIAFERSRLRLHVAEGAVERGLRDPALERFLPYVFDEGREGRRVDGRCRDRGRRRAGGSRRRLGLPRVGEPCRKANQRQDERDPAKHVTTVARSHAGLWALGSGSGSGHCSPQSPKPKAQSPKPKAQSPEPKA